LSAQKVSQGWSRATIGNLIERNAGFLSEKRGGEMASSAVARNRRFQRLLLHQADEVLKRTRRERVAADQDQGGAIDEHHRNESLERVKRQRFVESDIRGDLQIVNEQRVAI